VSHSHWDRAFALAALVVAASGSATRADQDSGKSARRTLAESAGAVPRGCSSPNCATVLAARRVDLNEPAPPILVQGPVKRNPPFGPTDPHVPPILQPSAVVQKHKEVWVVEVRRRDGTVESIEQNFPVLFQAGDWMLVEGDRIRAPE